MSKLFHIRKGASLFYISKDKWGIVDHAASLTQAQCDELINEFSKSWTKQDLELLDVVETFESIHNIEM